MCLLKLKDINPVFEDKNHWFTAYKAFRLSEKGLNFILYKDKKCLSFNKIYTVTSKARIRVPDKTTYETGFHIYQNIGDALKGYAFHSAVGLVILPVKFKNVVAQGTQYEANIIVAKSLIILPA